MQISHIPIIIRSTTATLGIIVLFTTAVFAMAVARADADTRASSRDGRGLPSRISEEPASEEETEPAQESEEPSEGSTESGITNTTEGEADTGGNSGGDVETGDESVEVTVVNIGPTNPPVDEGEGEGSNGEEEKDTDESPSQADECGRRLSNDCVAGDARRAR